MIAPPRGYRFASVSGWKRRHFVKRTALRHGQEALCGVRVVHETVGDAPAPTAEVCRRCVTVARTAGAKVRRTV